MENKKSFGITDRKKILISKDFREVLIKQETSLIEQRIIVNILASIKEGQSQFISVKQPDRATFSKQLSFDDYFDGWANQGTVSFSLSLKDLNPKRTMKNLSIKTALINMTNINWLQLKDDSINGFRAVPFLLEPSWNRSFIFFKMDKAVMQHLMNMSQFYQIDRNFPYQASSSNTLRFLMWISKFGKLVRFRKEYYTILKELSIKKEKYESRSKFERDYLQNVKADLDSFNDLSFRYKFDGGYYSFELYKIPKSIKKDHRSESLNTLKIDRALKYIAKRRNLDETNLLVMKRLYQTKGYDELSKTLKGKIPFEIKGCEFINYVFKLQE